MIAIAMIGIDENPDDDAIEGIAQVPRQVHEGFKAVSDEVRPNGTGRSGLSLASVLVASASAVAWVVGHLD